MKLGKCVLFAYFSLRTLYLVYDINIAYTFYLDISGNKARGLKGKPYPQMPQINSGLLHLEQGLANVFCKDPDCK